MDIHIDTTVEIVPFGFDNDDTSVPLDDPRYRTSLVHAYQRVYSTPPYDELFSHDEVFETVDKYPTFDHEGVIVRDVNTDEIVGFTFGFVVPPGRKGDAEWIAHNGFEAVVGESALEGSLFDGRTFYGEEFGVIPVYRNHGLGGRMARSLLDRVGGRSDIDRALLKTNAGNHVVDNLYRPMGFESLGVTEETTQRRVDGSERSDTREWFVNQLN